MLLRARLPSGAVRDSRSRRAVSVLTRAHGYRPSSRRIQVLQSHESEFFWGQPGTAVYDMTVSSIELDTEDLKYGTDIPAAKTLHRRVEAAHTPAELMGILQEPELHMLPETMALALLRLAAWHTDASTSAGLDAAEMLRAVATLEDQVLTLAPQQCSASSMANMLWSLATLRGPSCPPPPSDTTPARGSRSSNATALSDSQAAAGCRWPFGDLVLDKVVDWGLMHKADFSHCATHDMVSMVWGYTALLAQEQASAAATGLGLGGGFSQNAAEDSTKALSGELDRVAGSGASTSSGAAGMEAQAQQQYMFTPVMVTERPTTPGQQAACRDVQQQHRQEQAGMRDAVLEQARRVELLDAMCMDLVQRLRETSTGNEFQPVDLTDVIWGVAAVEIRSSAVAQLVESVAHEVYRQISNRHSLTAAFLPADLVKLLRAYADLQVHDAVVSRMLDAVAGFVVKRIRARHVHAVTKPGDMAAILKGFADLGHSTVVVPELVLASAQQVVNELAQHHEWMHTNVAFPGDLGGPALPTTGSGAASTSGRDSQQQQGALGGFTSVQARVWARSWSMYITPEMASCILAAYHKLGYYPGSALVSSLILAFLPQLPLSTPEALTRLISLLAAFRHQPGAQALHMLVSSVHQRADSFTRVQLAQVLCACGALGYKPAAEFVDVVCQRCLLDICDEELPASSSSHGNSRGSSSEAGEDAIDGDDACCILFALVVMREVTIQRLGLACMKIRESGALDSSSRRSSRVDVAGTGPGGVARSVLGSWGLGAVQAAAEVLGEEGQEMVAEVLPASSVRTCREALQRLLEEWGAAQDSSSAATLAAVAKTFGLQRVEVRRMYGADVSDALVLGSPDTASAQMVANAAEEQKEEKEQQQQQEEQQQQQEQQQQEEGGGSSASWKGKALGEALVVDLVVREEVAVNTHDVMLGAVTFRKVLLQLLGYHVVPVGPAQVERVRNNSADFAAALRGA